MARVLVPQMARRYNHNPQGSSTATVTMAAHNPWESRATLVNRQLAGGALPGMSGLGDTVAQAPASPDLSQVGINALAQALQASTQIATTRVNQLYGQQASNLVGQAAQALPIVNGQRPPLAPKHPYLPWAIGGSAIAAAALGVYLLMRRKKR